MKRYQRSLQAPEEEFGSPSSDSILFTLVIRDDTLLADVGVHPSEEVRSAAKDLLNRKPTAGWDTLNVRGRTIKGLRFHVYEMQKGDTPLIWTFACVYDSASLSKLKAQLFLQKIVTITELQRFLDDTWREGEYRSCRAVFSPVLLQQMKQLSPIGPDEDDLGTSERIVKANQVIINDFERRKPKKEAETKNSPTEKSSRRLSFNLRSFKNAGHEASLGTEGRDTKSVSTSPVKEIHELSDTTESMSDESQSSFDILPSSPMSTSCPSVLEIHPKSTDARATVKDVSDPEMHSESSKVEAIPEDASVGSRESSRFDEEEARRIKSQWKGVVNRRASIIRSKARVLASVKIQTAMRAYMARSFKAKKIHSAIVLQSMVRANLCWKRTLIWKLHSMNTSLELMVQARHQRVSRAGIQRFWRVLASRQLQETMIDSALWIQSVARGYMCRRRTMVLRRDYAAKREKACVKIQAVVRSYLVWSAMREF